MGGNRKESQERRRRARVLCAQALSLGITVSTFEILENIESWERIIHSHAVAKTRQEHTKHA